MPSTRRAFTLLEMTVVIVILAIMASLAVPRLLGQERREIEVVAERISDLMFMFAQRETLDPQPVGLQFHPERRELMLLELVEVDAGAEPEWHVDRYVDPVFIPEGIELAAVLIDGDPSDIATWPLANTPGEQRPSLEVVLRGYDRTISVQLPAHSLGPRLIEYGEADTPLREPVDLDAQGRSREDW